MSLAGRRRGQVKDRFPNGFLLWPAVQKLSRSIPKPHLALQIGGNDGLTYRIQQNFDAVGLRQLDSNNTPTGRALGES
jgi:hypothetical protein